MNNLFDTSNSNSDISAVASQSFLTFRTTISKGFTLTYNCKIYLKKLAELLQPIELFLNLVVSNVTQILSNGFIHYIRISDKFLAQGTFRWNGVTLLFPSLGFFMPLTSAIHSLTNKTATS